MIEAVKKRVEREQSKLNLKWTKLHIEIKSTASEPSPLLPPAKTTSGPHFGEVHDAMRSYLQIHPMLAASFQ